ncbi:MAG: hypothetical protein AAGI01_17815, partial [Myxococcota bacterium]
EEADRIDICTFGSLDSVVVQSGAAPYSQVDFVPGTILCTGARDSDEILTMKAELQRRAREAACIFELNIPDDPDMYNQPTYPQVSALEDPLATLVKLDHELFGVLTIPYCDTSMSDCGLYEDVLDATGDSMLAEEFRDEGWAWSALGAPRSRVLLTERLCDEVMDRKVIRATSQLACQCLFEGEACSVAGEKGRCAQGVYVCDRTKLDVCAPLFRSMPEVCNGVDDNCDGIEDNLAASAGAWDVVGGLPEEVEGLTCGFRDACTCPEQGEHVGAGLFDGLSEDDERANYIADNRFQPCVCGQGLGGGSGRTLRGASQPDSTSTDAGAVGCSSASVTSAHGAASLLLPLLGILVFACRRRA